MSTHKSEKIPQPGEYPTFWAFLEALSGLEDYVGRYNPATKELEIRHIADLPPTAKIIGKRNDR